MSQYTKIQLISWELYTGPVIATHDTSRGWYAGLLAGPTARTAEPDKRVDVIGQCVDIDARVAFTADAIAKGHELSDPSPDTLKVFLAPEFLYRGAGGAYLTDLISGWNGVAPARLGIASQIPYYHTWPGLIPSLQALAAQHGNEDWLFVFGSAISAAFPSRKSGTAPWLLDPAQARIVCNTTLIQRGGPAHATQQTRVDKCYLPPIDFLDQYAGFVSHIGVPVKAGKPRTALRSEMLGRVEGSPVFRFDGLESASSLPLEFGIELGFDHAVSGNVLSGTSVPRHNYGNLRHTGERVRLQLVPSCGMNLIADSLWLQPGKDDAVHSYAFHCDGLSNVAGDQYGSHTQVWNRTHKLLETSNGHDHSKSVPRPALASSISAVTDSVAIGRHDIEGRALWNSGGDMAGAGTIRVVAPLPL